MTKQVVLTDAVIRQISDEIGAGGKVRDIAKRYNVTRQAIYARLASIKSPHVRAYVSSKVKAESADKVRDMFREGRGALEIATALSLPIWWVKREVRNLKKTASRDAIQ